MSCSDYVWWLGAMFDGLQNRSMETASLKVLFSVFSREQSFQYKKIFILWRELNNKQFNRTQILIF